MPRYYPGSSHLISRPPLKTSLSRDQNNGLVSILKGNSNTNLDKKNIQVMKMKVINDDSLLDKYKLCIINILSKGVINI